MRSALATFALVAFAVANPLPDGVTDPVSPEGGSPEGCSPDYDGTFKISQANVSSSTKRSIMPRDGSISLELELHDGVLTDSEGRTGYIADNRQFQFDKPPQAGAQYTSGFSVCQNDTLALGNNAIFYSCLSGDFYNLYDYNHDPQCFPVYLMAVGSGSPESYEGSSTSMEGAEASATPYASGEGSGDSGECTQIVDGQPQCATSTTPAAPVETGECTQFEDGQPQCTSAAEVSPVPTAAPVPGPTGSAGCSQISDGQPQCGPPTSYTGAPIASATGAAVAFGVQGGVYGIAAGVLAAAMF